MSGAAGGAKSPRVFISSTGLDLVAYRQAALEVCRQLELHVVAMEDFEAMGMGATEGSLHKLEAAQVYVGIYAHRYGYIEPPHTQSVTELEFTAAGERQLERLCFLVAPDFDWPPKLIDFKGHAALESFKESIDSSLIRAHFTTVDDFKLKLYRSLEAWRKRQLRGKGALANLAVDWRGDAAGLDYLSGLWERLPTVQTLGAGRGEDVQLWEVYTRLDVSARLGLGESVRGGESAAGSGVLLTHGEDGPTVAAEASGLGIAGDADYLAGLRRRLREEAKAAKKAKRINELEDYHRPATAVEAVAAAPRLVLLGPGGSGKSTFAKFLALCLAGEALGRREASLRQLNAQGKAASEVAGPWPHGGLLPLWVELHQLVRHASFPGPEKQGEAEHLLTYLESLSRAEGFASQLRQALLAEPSQVLLILDGLDETPAAGANRQRLRQVIEGFAKKYPHCRILVTSRPYAYEPGSPWRLDGAGFFEATLAPFDRSKIESFVHAWYGQLQARGHVREEQAQRQGQSLCREIRRTSYLEPLAERPLMLTMMAEVHFEWGGRFKGGRAGLYERCVDLLLDRWNELRDMLGGQSLAEHLGLDGEELRHAMEALAYRVHKDRGRAGKGPAEIPASEVWKALDEARRKVGAEGVNERKVMDYLRQRSSILVGLDDERYSFPHRSYQEFLAASYLAREGFPDLLLKEAQGDPSLWREVVQFAVGKVAETPFAAWALLEGLVPKAPPRNLQQEDPRLSLVLYAGLALREQGLWRGVQSRDRSKLNRIRLWLQRCLSLGALSPKDRALAGQVLALLGDRRPGVRLKKKLPWIRWVPVPAGSFLMGSREDDPEAFDDEKPMRSIALKAYEISRYPVTNDQYEVFVQAGGYTKKCREHWSAEGWRWKEKEEIIGPWSRGEIFDLGNHPRVGVSHWEAEAYCAWLSAQTGECIRLPSEEEWEKAARGREGRTYPWGEEAWGGRCNTEMVIASTSAVGSFPGGASLEGLQDLSGNVWEWCSTPMGSRRVVRGGSWDFDARDVRAAARLALVPGGRLNYLGFRLARGQQNRA